MLYRGSFLLSSLAAAEAALLTKPWPAGGFALRFLSFSVF